MQITIVQSEIERAIRDYVSSQLKVADGMEMVIELSATRGAEGFKATIDINPISEGAAKGVVTAPTLIAPKPAIFKPTTVVTNAPASESETAKEEEAPFESEPAQAGEEAQASETTAEELQPKEARNSDEGNSEGKTGAPAPATASRSLFKGLTKPKNN